MGYTNCKVLLEEGTGSVAKLISASPPLQCSLSHHRLSSLTVWTIRRLQCSLEHHGIQRPAELSRHAQSVYFRYAIRCVAEIRIQQTYSGPPHRGRMRASTAHAAFQSPDHSGPPGERIGWASHNVDQPPRLNNGAQANILLSESAGERCLEQEGSREVNETYPSMIFRPHRLHHPGMRPAEGCTLCQRSCWTLPLSTALLDWSEET
jgi:hypothetical protein